MNDALNDAIREGLKRRADRREVLASGGCLHPLVIEEQWGRTVCRKCGNDVEVDA